MVGNDDLDTGRKEVSLTDERWQNYHGKLESMPIEEFPTNPVMRQVMTLSGGEDFFRHISDDEAAGILSRFTEHPILLPLARDRKGHKVHIASEKYIFQVCLLKREFDIQGEDVLEIGSGYGGFCRIATLAMPGIRKYVLLDHPVMNRLSRTFLAGNDKVEWVDVQDRDQLKGRKFGLVVSNYCLSETPVEYRNWIYENVFPNCQGAFIIDGGKGDGPMMLELVHVMKDEFGNVESKSYPAAEYITVEVSRRVG